MAIGDKIDWRAGTIDPTTLQLIASAGAAQGAMYQSLGESVSKALEKDSEDYIVAAGKAFDKANEFSEDGDNEKSEKQRKKGINLFRKAGEKYNVSSDFYGGQATLRSEEDIYKFYGFDPKNAAKPEPEPFHKRDPNAKPVDKGFRFYEDDGQPDSVEQAISFIENIKSSNVVLPSGVTLPSVDEILGAGKEYLTDTVVPNLKNLYDYIKAGKYSPRPLSDDVLSQMNQDAFQSDTNRRTTPGVYLTPEQFSPNLINEKSVIEDADIILSTSGDFVEQWDRDEDTFLTDEASKIIKNEILNPFQDQQNPSNPSLESLNVGGDDPFSYIDFLSPSKEELKPLNFYNPSDYR